MNTTPKRVSRHTFLTIVAGVCLLTASSNGLAQPAAPAGGADAPKPMSQDEKMKWFREAKFGLFIHWGLYAVPAGTWKGQQIQGIGEWIMNKAKIPVKEYEPLAGQFNPTKFNAEEWVQMAEDAGMKYIVITSKHHDGFAMFGSQASKYNIVDATPFRRDPLKELAAACARHNMKLGFYYSQSQDWHEPGGAGNTWDFGSNDEKDKSGAFDKYLQEKAEPQVKELLTGYGPLALIWFDTARLMNAQRGRRFIDMVHALQPACLINGRLFEVQLVRGQPDAKGDYRTMGDNAIPRQVVREDWEVPATLNDTWGYKSYDNNWKTPELLTFKLVDIVSKGGNYLLNVGPTAEGLIPQPSQDNLRAVGRWLKINGESIYGAAPTPFGAELGTTDPNGSGFVAKTAWRCTTKPGRLFIHLFQWPAGSFELPVIKEKVTKAYLLADSSRKALTVTQKGETWSIALPQTAPDKVDSVLVVETVAD